MTYTAEKFSALPAETDGLWLGQIAPRHSDSTVLVNAINALTAEVRELHEAILTPERRLADIGLHYAGRLP